VDEAEAARISFLGTWTKLNVRGYSPFIQSHAAIATVKTIQIDLIFILVSL